MSCDVNPKNRLPRLFFPDPAVSSPLTCRYAGHTGCACHGRSAAASGRANAAAPSAAVEDLRRRLEDNDAFIAKMLARLRAFPDAAAAISEMLKPTGTPDSAPDFTWN